MGLREGEAEGQVALHEPLVTDVGLPAAGEKGRRIDPTLGAVTVTAMSADLGWDSFGQKRLREHWETLRPEQEVEWRSRAGDALASARRGCARLLACEVADRPPKVHEVVSLITCTAGVLGELRETLDAVDVDEHARSGPSLHS